MNPDISSHYHQVEGTWLALLDAQPGGQERAAVQPHSLRLPHGHRPGNELILP